MTQVINKKLMKCCDNCHKYMNGACAWLSLGNEYCDEIMETQKVITQLTNNWNELEEWLWNELDEYVKNNPKETYSKFVVIRIEDVLDKMKEIKEGNNVSSRN